MSSTLELLDRMINECLVKPMKGGGQMEWVLKMHRQKRNDPEKKYVIIVRSMGYEGATLEEAIIEAAKGEGLITK